MSFFSSRIREIEHQSVSACQFHEIQVKTNLTSAVGEWKVLPKDDTTSMEDNNENSTVVKGISLDTGTTIRIASMDRKCGGWDYEHFHDDLITPTPSINSFLITFEATARECIALALSPEPHYSMGKTYAIHIGAGGNLTTVLRRWLPSGDECVESTFSTIRVCKDFVFQKYRIVFQSGKIFVGTGNIPGRQCVAMMDDSLYDQLRPGQDKVKYIGLGNSSLHRHARDLKIRNFIISDVPSTLDVSTLSPDPTHDLSTNNNANTNSNTPYDRCLLQQYHQECAKAQSRALKYNTPMDNQPPGPDAFLKWSEARRLRANPEPGFITGIDVTSKEESDRRQRRKERFERDKKRRLEEENQQNNNHSVVEDSMDGSGNADRGMGIEPDSTASYNDTVIANDISIENQPDTPQENKILSPVQAYDNIDYIREHRMDPPGNDDISAEPVPEKIHLFAIDWAAFKQMRSDDIMASFSIYGPSYVEWLSELSCNVMFQDKFSAIRAMQAMSQEIPSPPPPTQPSSSSDEHQVFQTEHNESINDNDMIQNETNSTKDLANPKNISTPAPTPISQVLEDLGIKGWRFCSKFLIKKQNDRFGRRGTKSRFLLRVATTLDILEHRPTETPKPPPGFTTRAILGPGSDFPKQNERNHTRGRRGRDGHHGGANRGESSNRHQQNRGRDGGHGQRKAKRRRRNRDNDMEEDTMNGVPSALDQGLKAQR